MIDRPLAYRIAGWLSFLTGFLSLSQEIIWVRWVGFGHGGMPQSFSLVLAVFLVGIALGALLGKRRCAKSENLVFDLGFTLIIAGIFDALALYLAPFAMVLHPIGAPLLIVLVGLTAGIKGVIFPIVHQMGATADAKRVGKSFSRVYAANIAGATLGPLVTGFALLSFFSAAQVYVMFAVLSMVIGAWVVSLSQTRLPRLQLGLGGLLGLCLMVLLFRVPDPVARVAAKNSDGTGLVSLIQNRQGIVHTIDTKQPGGLTTFGGNVYDGRTGFDMEINANRLDRAYMMVTWHPAPKKVLIVGLSTGAWTKVIAGMPGIEQIDIVEINPAYATLIAQNTALNDILSDKRVKIYWDDGRRWLAANPQAKYDLIFQNNSFHWRAYISLLISEQYFREIKGHLNRGGIMAINTTGSADVFYTASKLFPHSVQYLNFVYVSSDPIRRHSNARSVLERSSVRINNVDRPAFGPELFVPGQIGDQLVNASIVTAAEYLKLAKPGKDPPTLITDLNLVTEYRHGRSLWTAYRQDR
jgi:predicted membrane-bound spermidine synthase